MHPIAQGLPVHAARRRRLGARHAIQDMRNRQYAAGDPAIAAPGRRLPKFSRRMLEPGDPNCLPHLAPLRIDPSATRESKLTMEGNPLKCTSQQFWRLVLQIETSLDYAA